MARPHAVEDGEIGRGRHNDSSSSRESSPQRPHKRSFSPTSDDGDLVVPPIADDDTPPPLERPLLRQPVGFAWDNSSSISNAPPALNMYQASLPFPSSSNSIVFLPGQEVPSLPLQVPKAKGSRPKSSDGKVTKKRRTTEYSSQTGRFRLNAYDPTPSEGPPLHHGQGPYSSLYRGTPPEATDRAFTAASPTPTLSSMGGGSTSPASSRNNSKTRSSAKRPKQIEGRAKPPTGKAKGSGSKAKSSGQGRASTSTTRASTSVSADHESPAARNVASSATRSAAGGVHYRHDYYGSNIHSVDDHHSPGSHVPFTEPRPSNTAAMSSAADTTDLGVRRVLRQLRMVTLLIQDLRSGIADHQLAEVKIPLKAADDTQDGFWADAKELSEKLQASPARIDGPARAYTLRGKYRQFFLRVTAENVDEYISANLVVKPDRTLDVVVEKLPDPGTLPPPPQIPRDLRSPTPESAPSSPVPTDRQTFYDPLAGLTKNYAYPSEIRPQRSPSAWSAENGASPQSHSPARTSYSSHEPTAVRRISASGSTSTATGLRKENRGYESPSSDEEPEKLDRIISKAIDTVIQNDCEWIDFFKATAVPQRASEVLKQYRFVQRMMDEWVGKRAPFSTHHHVVEAHHITRALHIDDPKYSSACTETLALLALYGPQGQHYEDDRIVAMINDTSDPEYNAKPIKRMLHLLREIDRDWKNKQPPGSAVSRVSGGE